MKVILCYLRLIATSFDKEVHTGLSEGSKAVEQLNKQMDIDKFEELKDKLDE